MFRRFGQETEVNGSLYGQLADRIAAHDELIDLLDANPEPAKRIPVLLFAAVHDLVLREPDLALAQWYGSVVESPRTDDAFPTFAALCHEREGDLRATIAVRTVQTNEVGRAALLVPAIRLVGAEVGPVSLVDVGTSAGLNQFVDLYRVDYEPGPTVGPSDSAVTLRCQTSGPEPDLGVQPTVTGRLGIDSSPIDLDDEAAARWLKACVWPFQVERFHRLEAAIALAAEQVSTIIIADAIAGLADAVAAAVTVGHPVVMHSWVMNYLPVEGQQAFAEVLAAIGAKQDLSWISVESPHMTVGLPFSPGSPHQSATNVFVTRWRSGQSDTALIAWGHAHGRHLTWGER